MRQEEVEFFSFRHLPARLPLTLAAALLGFREHEIPILLSERLLKPCGAPAPNAPKYFHTATLLQLSRDPKWIDRASIAVARHWQRKNRRRGLINTGEDLGHAE